MVVEDWLLHRKQYKQEISRVLPGFRAYFMSILPIVCILIGLAVSTVRRSRIFILTLLTYGSLLLPNIFVFVYNRYLFYSQSLQVIIIFFVAAFLINTLRRYISTKV